MTIPWLVVGALAITAACHREQAQVRDVSFAYHLGESTKSPGDDPTKPEPVTPDDPRVMNVSASVSPQQVARGGQAQQPEAEAPRDPATSSTPVQQPADIAPPSTTAEPNQPGVFSPPPSDAPAPAPPPQPAPPPAPSPAPQ